ncbi:MAG TPA: hypothetical protein H9746_09670 [Candidatus Butyricicoccus avistercoris]|uniref:Uncharacterized protein n=1 Tax=Candidatus Butyricicoccus avistercoris TaxID=2838518 RepID=A0A9D1PL30_9FIRM|nr:hypothetical protein [Candidatus Butyricicoccus avistercoris]
MPRIMEIIANETNGKSYNTEKYSFDTIGMPSFSYDDDGTKIMKWHISGETIRHKKPVPLYDYAKHLQSKTPIITYFLDGSRHTYKVDDISYNKQVYPVIAGQVGVGCCKRVNGLMHSEKFYRRIVLVLPNVCNADGWGDEEFFAAKTVKLNKSDELKKLGIEISAIIPYSMPKDKRKGKVEDSGIACVQDYMIQSEKEMVVELVKAGRINQDNYLLKDGSLEYKPMKTGRGDLRELQKIKHNYRWVIGVSKSFNPESIFDHTGRPNANYIADLPLFHRTPVALYENKDFLGDVQFGVWYIRIRDKKYTRTPFDGVIKVEKILMDEEYEKGIDSDEIDLLSATLINERTPTCYGTDKRWANHLYPVFLTESFVKSKYMSTEMFLQLF